MSFHPDGFVQFSGENAARILSGRDTGGEPKGLGVMFNPLFNPIRSGPTFGVSAWGLEEFDELEPSRDHVITFSQEEMYFRGCVPGTGTECISKPSFWSQDTGQAYEERNLH